MPSRHRRHLLAAALVVALLALAVGSHALFDGDDAPPGTATRRLGTDDRTRVDDGRRPLATEAPPTRSSRSPTQVEAAASQRGGTSGSGTPPQEPEDIYQTGAVITPRILAVKDRLGELISDCWETARAQRPDLRGDLHMSVRLTHDPELGNLVATAEIDRARTTILDREFLECATENVFAAEEILEELRRQSDPSGGNIVFEIDSQFPPPPLPTEPSWPPDDASPDCPDGTSLKGAKPPEGHRHWCALPDGTKHGHEHVWVDGRLQYIILYERGESSTLRMRRM
jgi:hypothetical protein